jgi:glucose/arabinose dehydrogenase
VLVAFSIDLADSTEGNEHRTVAALAFTAAQMIRQIAREAALAYHRDALPLFKVEARMMTLRSLCISIVLVALALPLHAGVPLERLKLPPGFKISVFAEDVPNARALALGTNGTVFVGTRSAGAVYALRDSSGNGKADQRFVLARGLRMPNGVAFRDGALYVAEVDRILRYDDIGKRLDNPPKPSVVFDKLPHETHHGWKFINFGPDGLLYIPIGAPCNVCDPGDPYASITRLDVASGKLDIFARGVRNSVGFDWQPESKTLWFTDNGRDMMGDDVPSCELNHAPKAGMHFGFPFCHQGDVPDPEFGKARKCDEFTPPALKVGPHVAPLGVRFYGGKMFPAEYRRRAFIALHGSWNRSSKSGYKVMMATIVGDKVEKYETFIEGWLQGQSNWGRPVDMLVLPDGSMLLSDDTADVVYRVTYAP